MGDGRQPSDVRPTLTLANSQPTPDRCFVDGGWVIQLGGARRLLGAQRTSSIAREIKSGRPYLELKKTGNELARGLSPENTTAE